MRNLLGMFVLLSLGLAALAQAPPQRALTVIQRVEPSGAGCPVGFQARHGQEGGLVSVGPPTKHRKQSYRILFTPAVGKAITEAKITLHGLAGGQVIPAGQRFNPEATESFNLSPAVEAKHLFQSTIYTEKLTGVRWIELNELTYEDGTKWQASDTAACRVAPNGFMLVAGTY